MSRTAIIASAIFFTTLQIACTKHYDPSFEAQDGIPGGSPLPSATPLILPTPDPTILPTPNPDPSPTPSASPTPSPTSSPTPSSTPVSGTLDTSFGTGGWVTTQFSTIVSPSNHDYGFQNRVQSDGKILIAGQSFRAVSANSWDFAISRYRTDGTLDTSFGSNGKSGTNLGNNEYGRTLTLQTDGNAIVGGWARRGNTNHFVLTRYTTTGFLDTSFATTGALVTSFSNHATQMATLLQSDGKILSGGYVNMGGPVRFTVARYRTSGVLDSTFASTGIAFTTLNGPSHLTALALQSDQKILAVGYTNGVGGKDFAVVRYKTNGSLDTSFGTAGKKVLDLNGQGDYAHDTIIQTDGKLLLSGVAGLGTSADFALVRLLPNGTLDSSFGTDGIQLTDFGTLSDTGTVIALQTDGKILQTGHHGDILLARYLSNGTLDSTFGSEGKVATDTGPGLEQAWGLSIHNGKIIVSGYTNNGSDYDFLLMRYHQ